MLVHFRNFLLCYRGRFVRIANNQSPVEEGIFGAAEINSVLSFINEALAEKAVN